MNESEILVETENILEEFKNNIQGTPWQDDYALAIKTLKEELKAPCVLAFAGKVKAGKSSLVNSLLGVDLAMTGTTETTATINVFKAGVPFSPDKPVLCHYTDGTTAWKEKTYLDSLQGTSERAIEEASRIDKLVFYIPNNTILNEVTIVDTPGIGADVGEDGNAHQIHTDAYFRLKERHKQETTNISNSADAVVYLFNTVPTQTDKTFLDALYDGGNGLTALNGVGVLSKIDKDFTQIENIPKFEKEFEQQLFTLVPTSAEMSKLIPDREKAIEIRNLLRKGFVTESAFRLAIRSETAFFHPNLPRCNLSVEERKAIVRKVSDKNFQWSTFMRIAERLYFCESVDEELSDLQRLSGIDTLREHIYDHFFKRSKMLRCHKILTEIRAMLSSITYSKYFLDSNENARLKDACVTACETLQPDVRAVLTGLVDKYIPSVEEVERMERNVLAFRRKVKDIRQQLHDLNASYVMYQRIMADSRQFTRSEITELEILLTGRPHDCDGQTRLRYWTAVYNSSKPNSIKQQAASLAKNMYQKKVFER